MSSLLWYVCGRPILVKMSDTSRKRQRTSMVWNYFIENVRHSRRVLEYSLRYSPSTLLANYSPRTALRASRVSPATSNIGRVLKRNPSGLIRFFVVVRAKRFRAFCCLICLMFVSLLAMPEWCGSISPTVVHCRFAGIDYMPFSAKDAIFISSMIGYWHDDVVSLSVRPSVMLCTVAKQYILQQNCLIKGIGSGS